MGHPIKHCLSEGWRNFGLRSLVVYRSNDCFARSIVRRPEHFMRKVFREWLIMRPIMNVCGVLLISAVMTLPLMAFEPAVAADIQSDFDETEDYRSVPMPPGFRIEHSERDGPVFADPRGKTLYYWPQNTMRNGITGDPKNQSLCTYVPTTKTAGLMSPYPPGLTLPELESRKSCAEVWPPVLADENSEPVGSFSIVAMKDGRKLWAYDEHVLYTSILDEEPGDVRGAVTRQHNGETPAPRKVAVAPPAIPPGFVIITTALGRQLLTDKNHSVYVFDGDGLEKSNCDETCTRKWKPVIAPASAQSQGKWSVIERSPGVRQWVFRKKPLYTHVLDPDIKSLEGSDSPGWHNVYTQKAPPPPLEFTMQETSSGIVLADSRGKTIYLYHCGDDSMDQLACDHPRAPQVYRLAICGGGKVERCLRDWPYVVAHADSQSKSRTWTVIEIDPQTGQFAQPGQDGSLRVWAYRGAPVYTYARDESPGDINGHANGEFGGSRNGFKAFFLRDDFFNNAG